MDVHVNKMMDSDHFLTVISLNILLQDLCRYSCQAGVPVSDVLQATVLLCPHFLDQ